MLEHAEEEEEEGEEARQQQPEAPGSQGGAQRHVVVPGELRACSGLVAGPLRESEAPC